MALASRASVVARQVTRNVTRGVRHMSMVPQDEAVKTSFLWRNIGFGGIVVVGIFIAREVMTEEEHGHHGPKYAHLKIRNKGLPWQAGGCDLFDMDCRKKYWEEQA